MFQKIYQIFCNKKIFKFDPNAAPSRGPVRLALEPPLPGGRLDNVDMLLGHQAPRASIPWISSGESPDIAGV
ncbi:hypothetical protein TNCV_2847481 [Trichonephila clavipes]|nr:hypothetical protein TNCV_2847481 [Trichonephila clavipes]